MQQVQHQEPAERAATTSEQRDGSWTETLDRLRVFVAARVGDAELAADITQDVVMRSVASDAFERADDPTAWLYRSARNAVIDHYRTRRAHDSLDQIDLLDRWPDPDGAGAELNEATRELARCLQPMLRELSPPARDALTRVDLDGQTHQHAARELGISVSGMKSRVQRARRQLKGLLEQCCVVQVDRTGAVSSYRPAGDDCGCSSAT